MGDVADQFLILPVEFDFFFCIILQPAAHLFQIPAQASQLVFGFCLQFKVQIPVPDILSRYLHLPQRPHDRPVNPEYQQSRRKNQHNDDSKYHIHKEFLHFRNHVAHIRDNKGTPLLPIRIVEIYLFNQRLGFSPQIDPVFRGILRFPIVWELSDHMVCLIHIRSHIDNGAFLANQQVCLLLLQLLVEFLQAGGVLHLARILLCHLGQFMVWLLRKP